MITMLLEDTTSKELNEEDTTILVRVLLASVKKAVGEKIVPSTEQRKSNFLPKAQKVRCQCHERWMLVTLIYLLVDNRLCSICWCVKTWCSLNQMIMLTE